MHHVLVRIYGISIHALRVEGDQSTAHGYHISLVISIHALRVEGDRSDRRNDVCKNDFNPRPPCGGRQKRNAN